MGFSLCPMHHPFGLRTRSTPHRVLSELYSRSWSDTAATRLSLWLSEAASVSRACVFHMGGKQCRAACADPNALLQSWLAGWLWVYLISSTGGCRVYYGTCRGATCSQCLLSMYMFLFFGCAEHSACCRTVISVSRHPTWPG